MGNITLVFAPTRPAVAIKTHHSSKRALFSDASTESKWLTGQQLAQQEFFQHLSLKSRQYEDLSTEASMGFQPPPQRLPCCVAIWPLTDLTVLTGFDRAILTKQLPPRKQNLWALQ